MPAMFKRARQELLLMLGAVTTALFGANDTLDLFGSGRDIDRWPFFVAFLFFAVAVIWRVLKLHDQIDDYEGKVRIAAKLSGMSANVPNPGPNKVSIHATVVWEVWSAVDVSVDRLALNVIYAYDTVWWRFWKKKKVPITGIPPNGDSTYYRKRYHASSHQPNIDHADFHYVADSAASEEPHWLLELVGIMHLSPLVVHCRG